MTDGKLIHKKVSLNFNRSLLIYMIEDALLLSLRVSQCLQSRCAPLCAMRVQMEKEDYQSHQ